MDTIHAGILRSQFTALSLLCEKRGIELPDIPSEEEIKELDPVTVGRWVRMLRDVLRTPTD